ncbi:MAG TPA: ABC transporter permease subunit [Acetobacteraceae bacterium]|jgi:general L-amino acid transport system permease protein|nr:ABC transporter permease subunit [Acetobacteraceae bacterium]
MIRRPSRRARAAQWVLLLGVVSAAVVLANLAGGNLARRHLDFGFGFLADHANFDIPFRLIPWEVGDTYGRALLVCTLNTLLVSVMGIVTATLLGLLVGVMRLSENWLVRNIALWFIEAVRNTPQLVQIIFWYVAVLQTLPAPRQSIHLPFGMLLNIRGLYVPALVDGTVQFPALHGFNIAGGTQIVPELVAVWAGLSIYASAFIAEIVRAAILSVHRGQREAALSLGLKPGQVMRKVVLPQALRVMVPPLTSQYLNLIKSSSLGAAVAYPELFQIFAGTVLNQSGRELETIMLLMAVFLSINLAASAFMNWYNHRVALVQR